MRDKFTLYQRVKLVRPLDPKDKDIVGTILSPRQLFRSSSGEYWEGYYINWDDGRKCSGAAEDRLERA
jgi:hypothetical protein